VLCEKALGLNSAEAKEMVQLAGEKNVFLMEAVWSRAFPLYEQLKAWIKEWKIGIVTILSHVSLHLKLSFSLQPMNVTANLCFRMTDNPDGPLMTQATGGGSVLDVLIYPIQLALLAMGGQRPLKVSKSKLHMAMDFLLYNDQITAKTVGLNKHGCDLGVSVILQFAGGENGTLRQATLTSDLRAFQDETATIGGSQGIIKVRKAPFTKK